MTEAAVTEEKPAESVTEVAQPTAAFGEAPKPKEGGENDTVSETAEASKPAEVVAAAPVDPDMDLIAKRQAMLEQL